jgi:hypothetical protein
MFDINELASSVIGSTKGKNISNQFGLDTVNYSWVDDYVRDQGIRAEIEDLQKKITDTEKLPIHKDELKARFTSLIEHINEFRIKQIASQLSSLQKREAPVYAEFAIGYLRVLDAPYLPYFIKLSESDITAIFSELPEGVKQKEIDSTIENCRKRINELEIVISKELSPQSRWLHHDNGVPISYPKGCRWNAFVEIWKLVQRRFDGPVNINGGRLKTNNEFRAHAALKLDTLSKMPPLRKPL